MGTFKTSLVAIVILLAACGGQLADEADENDSGDSSTLVSESSGILRLPGKYPKLDWPPSVPGQHLWSKDFGGATGYDTARGRSTAVDAQGNVFVTGTFTGRVDFSGTTRTTAGTDYDVFVTKYSPSGTVLWIRQIGGSGIDEGVSVAVDLSGDVLIAGYFYGTSDFGGGPLVSAGYSDGFVAKYSGSSGDPIWSKRFGGTTMDTALAVAVDGSGNVSVTGSFQGTIDFGLGPLTCVGSKDIFVAQYSAGGSPRWSKRLGGAGSDAAEAVAVDGSGNLLIAGTFQQTADFGGGPLVSAGGDDILLAKFSSAGAHVWSKRFGALGGETAHSVAAAANGDIVMSGEFNSSLDFGSGPLTNVGGTDAYLAAFDATGAARWSKRFGCDTTFGATGKSVAIDSLGNIALTGTILDLVDLGGGLLGPAGSNDPYVAKFTTLGAHVWSKRFTGSYDDYGFGIATDASGNVVVTGSFWETVDFGGGPLASAWPSGTDGFIAKYAP